MNTKKIGQGMFGAAFLLGLVTLTFFFGGVEERQRNPNQDPESVLNQQTVEVALKRNRAGHYVVTGAINNQPALFLLDTGATQVVVPAGIAGNLGLRRGRAGRAMTANGAVTVYETIVDKLDIGEISLYNVAASINPAMKGEEILLGMSALGQIEFIQSGDSLTLKQRGY